MNKRNYTYGLTAGIIIIVLMAANQISSLNNKVTSLEEEISELQLIVNTKENIINTLSEQIDFMEATINTLNTDLSESQQNYTRLISELKTLNSTLLELESDRIEEGVVDLIRQEEIRNVLLLYGETALELEHLQEDYDELLIEYNELLEQLGE